MRMPTSRVRRSDEIRHHAVDADRREQQRDAGKRAHQPGREARLRGLVIHRVTHRGDREHRDVGVDFANHLAHRGRERRGVDSRPDHERYLLAAIEERKIEVGIARRIVRQAPILHLADDADDRQPRMFDVSRLS